MAQRGEVSVVILLDTCSLLWLAADQDRLSAAAKTAIGENADRLFVSSISAFELAIKARKGKLELPMGPAIWYESALQHHGLTEVPIDGAIASLAVNLPPLHSDPCDRFIIATALHHGMAIVTCDVLISQYKEARVVW
ncbi:MAG: type II toxin-antitoxin system VapC family toxin [Bacteroidota bacterium]